MDENHQDKTESTLTATENKLWYPPLSPNDQKKLDKLRKKARKPTTAGLISLVIVVLALIFAWYAFRWAEWLLFLLIVIGILLLILLVRAVYTAQWTGFVGKTLWDWMDLSVKIIGAFIIPLTVIGLIVNINQFNNQQLHAQQQALDQQRQITLDTYFDRMQDLFLAKSDEFKVYKQGDEYQALAVARTWTALRNLDGMRKATLIRFLWEAQLINGPQPIISLNSANLLGADFNSATLIGVNLSGALLAGATFVGADLRGANLSGAYLTCGELEMGKEGCTDLSGADLGCIDLSGGKKSCADLRGAYLMGARMDNGTDLRGAILKGARYNTKPDQQVGSNEAPFILLPTQWPLGFVPKTTGAIICNDC